MQRLHRYWKNINWQLTLQADDKDMIVMYHKFVTEINGETKQIDRKWFV
jgi:hypothetical protein